MQASLSLRMRTTSGMTGSLACREVNMPAATTTASTTSGMTGSLACRESQCVCVCVCVCAFVCVCV